MMLSCWNIYTNPIVGRTSPGLTLFGTIARAVVQMYYSTLGDGSIVLFWVLSQDFPRLFLFDKNVRAYVEKIMSETDLDCIFNCPHSYQAYDECLELQGWLQTIAIDPAGRHIWVFQWPTSIFRSTRLSPSSGVLVARHGFNYLAGSSWWIGWIQRTCWGRNLNVGSSGTFCILCSENFEEDIDHLFFWLWLC